MEAPKIHVHTSSDKGTINYVVFMWDTMRMLANKPDLLNLSVHCMGWTAADRLAYMKNTKTYVVPDVQINHGLEGSVGHGACIEDALMMTDDGDIHIIVDSDTVVLAKGWDDYVRQHLLDHHVGVFGATYENIGAFSTGAGVTQTYKGIPNVVWMAMTPLARWQDLKALPAKETNIEITNETLAKTYGLPVGYHVLRDVAWQIPQYLVDHHINYDGWKQRKPQTDAVVLKGLIDYHEEYHVDGTVPFVVHHRGSMKHPYRSHGVSSQFFSAVDAWLEQEKQREPRWTWEPQSHHTEMLQNLIDQKTAASERLTMHLNRSWSGKQQLLTSIPVDYKMLDGWLKMTLDGEVIRSRHIDRVPSVVDVVYKPNGRTPPLRLEGNVSEKGLKIRVPSYATSPHTLIVRNLTNVDVEVGTLDNARGTVTVPMGSCLSLLVDVDGLVYVQTHVA